MKEYKLVVSEGLLNHMQNEIPKLGGKILTVTPKGNDYTITYQMPSENANQVLLGIDGWNK